ncbi:phytoene dehydrogenase-like protein [Actinomadura coerulea]|uniref:Pyridine nucleotide-disulfide oxidoreductase domain-containing protein 2 n=1 Tax=Actinomadura coerulea TaxID=46159 RepID=A0A7X0KYS1_9ACTN|nr:NAD(P)/FAD-dependent oxidoreductase [Actinomadura coerulea]MBB6395703.1 phytoene dehydrogenase-like protein [Actinomadura coerulea]GGQ26526.1 dehydrogenase [Actinomadura coerulea]
MEEYDAVVIGGGHNGLVAALYLVRAGWSVAVLEQAGAVGGAIASGEVTLPGFVHDLYATNQNLFVASQAHADFGPDLARHGLRFRVCDRPFANAFPGGRSLRVYCGYERTLDGLAAHDAGDAEGFADLYRFYQRFAPHLFRFYGCAVPSAAAAREAARLLARHRLRGAGELVRTLLMSTRELGESLFATREARAMAACWGMHLDLAPDVAGGAVFPILEIFSDMETGMAVVEGGAGRLPEALAAVVAEGGGTVRTGVEVDRVLCRNGRAAGVRTTDGTRVAARRAVIANVGPRALYERLLPPAGVPASVRRGIRTYQYGPGTLMLHLALDGPVPWAAGGELSRFGYVHVAPYVDDLARTYAEAQAGLLPADPLLVVGQTSAIDPGRAPAGRDTLWVQVRAVPAEIRGDAADVIRGRAWPDVADAMTERVLAKLERYAPGVTGLVAACAALTPRDLEEANPNLVGGDNGAGSHHLTQNFMFRPLAGHSRYRTAVPGLYLTGAATWPGAGTNATSGRLTARQVLRDAHGGRRRLRARR